MTTTETETKSERERERQHRAGRAAIAAQEHGHFNRTKPDTQEGEREMDLSNARIIEWDFYGETQVGARQSRGERFQYAYRGRAHTVSEEEIRTLWEGPPVRVVAEFPRPSLAEVVGDAPAFQFEHRDNRGQAGQCIAWWGGDGWMWARRMFYGGGSTPSRLDQIPVGDLASVVPLVPREAKP